MMNEAADNINSASNEPESVSEYNFATQTVDSLFQLDLAKYMKNIPSLHDEASLEYGNMLKPLDQIKQGAGNFYLQPNGVFFIDKNRQPGVVWYDVSNG